MVVLRKKGKPDPTPARAEKRTASRFYQLKSGNALTGVYLKSTGNRPDDHCWWCDPENDYGTHQTRDHLFKHCDRWKDQQAKCKGEFDILLEPGKNTFKSLRWDIN